MRTVDRRTSVRRISDSSDDTISVISMKKNRKPSRVSRTILWYLVFTGFMIDSMIRITTSITVVDMVLPRRELISSNVILSPTEPIQCMNCSATGFSATSNNSSWNTIAYKNLAEKARFSLERIVLDSLGVNYSRNGFPWNEYQQGLVLGSFYWLNWITQIPGGIIARRYGTKLVFGMVTFTSCIVCCLMPISAFMDFRIFIILRMLQGCIFGFNWPAMHSLVGKWIPPNERSKFVTAYMGTAFGMTVFFPLFGLIISVSSWEWVYYTCGVVGLLWFVCWQYFVYDSPGQHPRIDNDEREHIEKALGDSIQTKGNLGKTPWLEIMTSRAVWIVAICQWGTVWSITTMGAQSPTYFKVTHGMAAALSGTLSGLPYLLKIVFAYGFSMLADYLLRSERMSRTNVRKMAGSLCTIGVGVCLLGMAQSGDNAVMAVVWFTLANVVHGANTSGPLANQVDLSPNFAGIVLGITASCSAMTGYISPYMVGALTLNNQTKRQWQIILWISAAISIVSGLIYACFADARLQKWNSPAKRNDAELQEINLPIAEMNHSKSSEEVKIQNNSNMFKK